jgi:3-dehydroquinate synthase
MNTFNIAGKQLKAISKPSDQLTIQSFPRSYRVNFKEFKNEFTSDQVVLVDSNVQRLYNIQHTKLIVVEATEGNKTIDTVLDVCERLMEFGFDKGHTLVVIGGGIVQDIGAYTAKTYRRGINWIFYPTTLLSQCDSCIGGKTALNFRRYKNQLALFSAPTEVIIDLGFLSTLSEQDIKSGHGEIIKLFLTGGDYYVNNYDTFTTKELVFHALAIKQAVVEYDEFENRERKALNYGHSFGHVIETLTNYDIPHGEAVMLGIEIINQLFTKSQTITNFISKHTGLHRIANIDVNQLVQGLLTDKKVSNGTITFVVVSNSGLTEFLQISVDESLYNKVYEIFAN